jgi:SAM-dependent methyltransferase
MLNEKDYRKAWNDRVSDITAHRILDGKFMTEKGLYSCYKKGIDGIDLNDKMIIDFGCGGGFFGRFCFDDFEPKKYIGLDISEKSIVSAKNNLEYIPDELKELFLFSPIEILSKIKEFKADVFCSFSVIQHLPDIDYLNLFLKNVNESGISDLCLQIRYSDMNRFFDVPYKTTADIGHACYTNHEYMIKVLDKYTLKSKSSISENLYQYLTYSMKRHTI